MSLWWWRCSRSLAHCSRLTKSNWWLENPLLSEIKFAIFWWAKSRKIFKIIIQYELNSIQIDLNWNWNLNRYQNRDPHSDNRTELHDNKYYNKTKFFKGYKIRVIGWNAARWPRRRRRRWQRMRQRLWRCPIDKWRTETMASTLLTSFITNSQCSMRVKQQM